MVHVLCAVGIHSLAWCLGCGPVDGVVERALLGPLRVACVAVVVAVCRPARSMSCSCAQCLGIAAWWRVVEGVGVGSPDCCRGHMPSRSLVGGHV